jgi:hypothetical protein
MRDRPFVGCDDMTSSGEGGPDMGESRLTRGGIQGGDLCDDIAGSPIEELFRR